MRSRFLRTTPFLAAFRAYHEARSVLVGVPLDVTTSFRPGTRWGPRAIREVSEVLEEYSPRLGRDLREIPLADLGDLDLVPGRVEKNLQLIQEMAEEIFSHGKLPFFLGGEHLITYPLAKAAARFYPGLVVLQLDAHADLREDYLGQRLSHATVMRLLTTELGGKNIYQLGVRSGTREEFEYGYNHTHFYPGDLAAPLEELKLSLVGRPVYLTLDIDVVDPAFAPGTGTPEPGGCTSQEILETLYALRGLNIVAFDLVEVCPPYDHGNVTAVLAAKILREAVLVIEPPAAGQTEHGGSLTR
ncbi:MAG: agmatinase [Clostridia bacterium]|nr:agmatinase [Clostridia bacterium]